MCTWSCITLMFSLCSLTGKTWHLWELGRNSSVLCLMLWRHHSLQHSKLVERSMCPCYGSFDFTQEVSGRIKKTTSTNAPVILGDVTTIEECLWYLLISLCLRGLLLKSVREWCVLFFDPISDTLDSVSASAGACSQPSAALHVHSSHLFILPLMKPPLS